jgi:hypothetical protein
MSVKTKMIPAPDEEFDNFFKAFHDAVTANPKGFGLSADDVTLIQTTYAAWAVAFPAHKASQLKSQQDTSIKNKVRDDGEAATRSLAKKINGNPAVDNAMRAQAAMPAHSETKSSIGAPTTAPVGRMEVGGRNTLIFHFTDAETPLVLAKPHGVHACEIRFFVGDIAPADEADFAFLAHDTRTPYTNTFPAADAGKTVHYLGRWLNAKLEPGPWGHVVSAKIPH